MPVRRVRVSASFRSVSLVGGVTVASRSKCPARKENWMGAWFCVAGRRELPTAEAMGTGI